MKLPFIKYGTQFLNLFHFPYCFPFTSLVSFAELDEISLVIVRSVIDQCNTLSFIF